MAHLSQLQVKFAEEWLFSEIPDSWRFYVLLRRKREAFTERTFNFISPWPVSLKRDVVSNGYGQYSQNRRCYLLPSVQNLTLHGVLPSTSEE